MSGKSNEMLKYARNDRLESKSRNNSRCNPKCLSKNYPRNNQCHTYRPSKTDWI